MKREQVSTNSPFCVEVQEDIETVCREYFNTQKEAIAYFDERKGFRRWLVKELYYENGSDESSGGKKC